MNVIRVFNGWNVLSVSLGLSLSLSSRSLYRILENVIYSQYRFSYRAMQTSTQSNLGV